MQRTDLKNLVGEWSGTNKLWLMPDTPAEESESKADIVWTDSWHMQNEFMILRAEPAPELLISARGSYAAPPGPDWGWRIALRSDGPDAFTMLMYNATPEGQEDAAVEVVYSRVS